MSSSSVIEDRHTDDQITVLAKSSSSKTTPSIDLSIDNNEVVNVSTDQKSR